MGDKTALVVEDHVGMIRVLTRNLEVRGYDVTSINYIESKEIPEDRFDLAIIDGLDGDGLKVLQSVNAERKFLYTGSFVIEKVAIKAGVEVHSKSELLDKILEEAK